MFHKLNPLRRTLTLVVIPTLVVSSLTLATVVLLRPHVTANKVDGQSVSPLDAPSDPATSTSVTASYDSVSGRLVGTISREAQAVGSSGVSIRAAKGSGITDATVELLTGKAAAAYGHSGFAIKITPTSTTNDSSTVAISVPQSVLARIYGADYSSRTAWSTRTVGSSATPKAATTSVSSSSVLVMAKVASKPMVVMSSGAPVSSSGTGSFAATPLSAANSWDESAQTGDFSWKYALRTPPASAGPAPSLAFNYDSQSVDGESASTNNQPSAIGDGWSLAGGGFIERSYVPCSQDTAPVTASGDECWKTDNATISFAGHSGLLVKDSASGTWRLQSDDGSRIDHLIGTLAGCAANGTYDSDCWRVTTTNGDQYWFGLNQLPGWSAGNPTTNSAWTVPVFGNDSGEPCHGATFSTSSCMQGWRWNLDYVVDVHGNAESLYYNAETNSYAVNGATTTSYTRGGQLSHIDYGFTTGNAYATNAASDRVTFGYSSTGRCSDASGVNCTTEPASGAATAPAHAAAYPDVPFDQNCSSACSSLTSPTFWTTAMLTGVSTSVLKSGSYQQVDSWTLGHSFPDPGDSTNAALWLTKISHTGTAGGSISEPDTVFTGIPLQNRVWVKDGLAPLDKYRVSSVQTSTGGVITVNYSDQQCTPANAATIEANLNTNTNRCFPQWWTPQIAAPQAPKLDLFHKYVVTSLVQDPHTGGGADQAQETDYLYTGTPAWRYDTSPLTPDSKRTWSGYAGYNSIEIRQGAANTPSQQVTTDYTFFQGMDGDRASTSGGTKTVYVNGSTTLKDSLWFAGQPRDTKQLAGVGGSALSDTITTPWASSVTANDGTNQARISGTSDSTTTSTTSTGAARITETTNTFDPTTGLVLTSNQTASGAPTTCTTTSYAPANATVGLLGLVSEVNTVAVDCSVLASAVYPAAAISDVRTSYDALAWGATPVKGDATKVQTVKNYTGTTAATAQWITSSQAGFDSLGRGVSSTDVLGHTTTTAYTPAASAAAGSGPVTSITSTNTFGWTTTTAIDPAWGAETQVADQNGSITTASYDALGRRIAVWYPDNTQATNPSQPNIAYKYTLSQTAANVVETDTMLPSSIQPGYELYDGLGRLVQTQKPTQGSGTIVTDNWYDSLGRTWVTNSAYWAAVTASGTQFVPSTESQVPSEQMTTYDGAGRTTASILYSLGAERYRTSYSYPGVDRTDTTPPSGGVPTSTYTDARGNTTQLVQYLASSISATATTESTSYVYDPSGHRTGMSDPAGNQWSWQFDVLGRQTSAIDPDSGTTTSTYDDAGNVLSVTDGRGVSLAYSYDALNRETAETTPVSGGNALLASWVYDTVAKGQLSSSTSYVGSTASASGAAYTKSVDSYDAQYNPTSTTLSIPSAAPAFAGISYTTTYGYTVSGAPAAVNYPAMGGLALERLRYSYNSFGQLASIGSYDLVTYTPIGQVAQDHSHKTQDVYRGYGYDQANGRLLSIADTSLTGTTSTNLATTAYAYDNAGNLTQQSATSDSSATDTQCFKYDQLANLSQAYTPGSGSCAAAPTASTLGGPAPYWVDYSVSPTSGNRLSTVAHTSGGTTTTSSYSYPAAGSAHPHAVSQIATTGGTTSTTTYGYDAAGDTTTRGTGTVGWNQIGKADTVTQGTTSQSNIYDADGALLLQTDTTAGATLTIGATELHIAAGSSTITATRTYSRGDTPVAERSTTTGSVVQTWLLADKQNTIYGQINDTTAALALRRQDPFGNTRAGSAPIWSDGHGFLNKIASAVTGLTQLGDRLYDSSVGRFISVDPVLAPLNPQQNDGYSYGANAPTNNTDPTGDCYNSETGAFNMVRNCAGTNSQNGYQPGANNIPKPPKAAGNAHGRAPTTVDVSNYSWKMLNEWLSTADARKYVQIGKNSNSNYLFNRELADGVVYYGGGWGGFGAGLDLANTQTFNDGPRLLKAAHGLHDHFATNGDWDMKVYLRSEFDLTANDVTGTPGGPQIRQDVFGNVNYGVMMSQFGVSEKTAINASNIRTAGAGLPDKADDAAIRLGYQMAKTYPKGMSSGEYLAFILDHGPAETVSNPK